MRTTSPLQRRLFLAAAVVCGAAAVLDAVLAAMSRGSVTAHVIAAVCLGAAALGNAWRLRQARDHSGPRG